MTTDLDGPWQQALRGAGLLRADGTAGVTIFAEMTALATELGALNLGQGFPDDDPPAQLLAAAVAALGSGANQYPPGRGIPSLRQAIAQHQQRFWGVTVDPDTEVLVTAGATEALAATLLALVRPGDEVLTVEPFYDAYGAVISLAGGSHTTVPLRMVDGAFALDPDELTAAVTDRTRVILVNNPNNPTGYQWPRELLALLVELAHRHDAVIVTDEVYEHLCFDAPHVPVATLPGAAGRTLTISSAGKTFSATGWKVGWVHGAAPLVTAVEAVKQWLTYTNAAPLQPAVAVGLALPDEVFASRRDDLRARRDQLVAGLRAAGMETFVPSAGYFTIADAAALGITDAAAGARELAHRIGVVGIPYPAFCHAGSPVGQGWIRFAHCKRREVIAEAAQRLAAVGGAPG